MTALDVLIVVWGAAAFLIGMLASNAPYEEVDGDHLGGTAAVENTNTQNERASA